MARTQPTPTSSKKTANPTTTTAGTRSSFTKSLTSSGQAKNTKLTRLCLRTPTMNQQQNIQQQEDQDSTHSQQPQLQRPPQQLSSYNDKDGNRHKKDAKARDRVLKKRRLSKPVRSQVYVGDSERDKDVPQERDDLGGSGATMGIRGKTHRALACNEPTEATQDDEGNDTDDFQTRPGPTRSMVRGRRHEYGQNHGSNSNNTAITTTHRGVSDMPPYPEHLLSTLPERPACLPSTQPQGTANTSARSNPATQAPSRKRPLSRAPSRISDAPKKALHMTMTTLRKPKVEETDGKRGPLRSSQFLPAGGPPHESDVYKAMEDHGTDLWRDWCKRMAYSDNDRVTALKLKDYIDFEVMPKDREMMRKSWRLPGHPEFIAVSALEAYIRPVIRLWYEQSLEAELEAIRDAKQKSTRSQQTQQPLQPPTPPTPNSQPRQARPRPKPRQPHLKLPPKATFASTNKQLLNTIAIHTMVIRAERTAENQENVEKEGKGRGKKDMGEQEKRGAAKNDDKDRENNTSNNRVDAANISGDHTTPDSSEINGKDPTGKDEERGAAAKRTPVTNSELVATSTPSLPTTSSIPAPASPPNIPPPTPRSSQPVTGESQIRAKDIQLLRIMNLASPKIDYGLYDRAIKHRLHPRVTTIAGMLTEWTVGIDGGPSIQQLNSDYGLFWQHSDDEKEYPDREAIVREFKRLVFEDGKTDQEAQKLLEDELASSSKADVAARLRTSRRASPSSLTAA
ncbi:hypothetical protein BGZ88_007860 [Linnemannia elongata]|nr:hypothetical protein BGZ88_007860 [Linnemannia elongata]